MCYQWIAGVVTLGRTGGFFYSDGTRKTRYRCFNDKEFRS